MRPILILFNARLYSLQVLFLWQNGNTFERSFQSRNFIFRGMWERNRSRCCEARVRDMPRSDIQNGISCRPGKLFYLRAAQGRPSLTHIYIYIRIQEACGRPPRLSEDISKETRRRTPFYGALSFNNLYAPSARDSISRVTHTEEHRVYVCVWGWGPSVSDYKSFFDATC